MLSPSWQSDGPDGWPASHIVWALVLGTGRLDFIVELFPDRAAARETTAGVSGYPWICMECVIKFIWIECVTSRNPSGCFRIPVDLRKVRDRVSSAQVRRLEFSEFPLF